jgi:hypothetical protein
MLFEDRLSLSCVVQSLCLQDSITEEVEKPYGPRLCTVLLYLNDVEEGGETAFPDTGVSSIIGVTQV